MVGKLKLAAIAFGLFSLLVVGYKYYQYLFLRKNMKQETSLSSTEIQKGSHPIKDKAGLGSKGFVAVPSRANEPSKGPSDPTHRISSETGSPKGALEGLLQRWDPNANWTVRREGNSLVRAISGGLIPDFGKDKQSVQDFLNQLGDNLGVPGHEIGPVNQRTFDVEHVYEAKQVIQGYEVYDGFVKVFARTQDGTIYYLASELKEVSHPLLSRDVDEESARSIVTRTYSGKKIEIEPRDESKGKSPQIYVKDSTTSELAWIFYVKILEPKYDRRLIFVGTQTGQILSNNTLLIH